MLGFQNEYHIEEFRRMVVKMVPVGEINNNDNKLFWRFIFT
jgi:hypothetical protein